LFLFPEKPFHTASSRHVPCIDALHTNLRNVQEGSTLIQESDMEPSKPFSGECFPQNPYVFSVSSGKGGVGKTNTVINLALELQRSGQRVLVFDADLGLSSVPVSLGIPTDHDLSHVLLGDMSLRDVMITGPEGVTILPAGVGIPELTDLTQEQQMKLVCQTEELEQSFDMVLVDTGGGISANVIFFNLASRHNIILVYPEPSAIADAYALIKILAVRYHRKRFLLLLNGTRNEQEAQQVYERFSLACERLLHVSISYCGAIPFDDCIRHSVRTQRPVVQGYPEAASSKSFRELASRLVHLAPTGGPSGSMRFFWNGRQTPGWSGSLNEHLLSGNF
jgi:flagellar biosynthesis protein FlhG